MGLNVGSVPVTAVYVGSTPVTAVHVGAQKVWPVGPRKVTINQSRIIGEWDRASATGDTGLIQGWGNAKEVQFRTAVTCDKSVYSSDSGVAQSPGTILRAGALIRPYGATSSYTFTEVL